MLHRTYFKVLVLALAFAFCAFVLAGCGYFRDPGTPVAKVKDHVLTLEELRAGGEVQRDSLIHAVEAWVNHEVLYQEAMGSGIQNDPEVAWLLRDAERKIIVDAFMRRFDKSIADPEEGELEAYYEKHKDQFVRIEPEFRFRKFLFSNLQIAKDSLKIIQAWPDTGLDSLHFLPLSHVGKCIAGVSATLQANAYSIPQLCNGQALVIKLYGRKAAGELLSFEDARSQVTLAARIERKNHKLDSLLLEAKSRQAVFTWPENLPPH